MYNVSTQMSTVKCHFPHCPSRFSDYESPPCCVLKLSTKSVIIKSQILQNIIITLIRNNCIQSASKYCVNVSPFQSGGYFFLIFSCKLKASINSKNRHKAKLTLCDYIKRKNGSHFEFFLSLVFQLLSQFLLN